MRRRDIAQWRGHRAMDGLVARRAAAINTEYWIKARSLDRTWPPTPEGSLGSVETKFRRYNNVRGLVFGAWSEASIDVEWLLHNIVDCACAGRGRPQSLR